ncbi:hypothetical protein HPP92_004894 [Vanilla planifolia]|uniref:Polygalacturonase n=1 Tax=Vanilla planifolia TaxID=51239 RepID=A0A835RG30_VANPL|nr:hypothetical protein HPP92_004894 [Vanilla planifolia]
MFNVLDYDAKGNGIADDTKAFLAAWGDACARESSTLLIPSGYGFLVGPLSLLGPCQPNIVLQIDGTVIAPTSPSYWKAGSMQWLQLKQLTKGITIQGGGLIEGQGNAWWGNAHGDETNFPRLLGAQSKGKLPSRRPTALRFYGSHNVTVSGITIQNSPQCHLKFDNCDSVRVSNITISSPGDSPNTDGIHLQNSANVEIRQSVISCGDDCISIQTGSSMVHVQSVTCGPGHGISIGSLGEGRTAAWVSNVTVEHVAFVGTLTGVRIKTWQGGSGSLRDVKFSNIRVSHVQTPIVINQYYSDGRSNKTNHRLSPYLKSPTIRSSAHTRSSRSTWPAVIASPARPCLYPIWTWSLKKTSTTCLLLIVGKHMECFMALSFLQLIV